jgi:hypothetical protein
LSFLIVTIIIKDEASDSMTVTCQDTSCHCSSWCNDMVATIIKGMHTTAEFECTISTADCNIKRKNYYSYKKYLKKQLKNMNYL